MKYEDIKIGEVYQSFESRDTEGIYIITSKFQDKLYIALEIKYEDERRSGSALGWPNNVTINEDVVIYDSSIMKPLPRSKRYYIINLFWREFRT
jgi:hypothetical protein